MGYTTRVRGEFTIRPPLAWPEFRDSRFAPHNVQNGYDPSLILRVDEDTVDTDEGLLVRRTATALVMREIDEYRAHGLIEEVQEAVDAFPGRQWSGRLDCAGEENLDVWRVLIRDGRAVKVKPEIVWPDGSDA